MALNPDSGVRMVVSLLASTAAVLAALLFLASLLMSGAFAGRVPAGSDAMGLVVPMFGSIGAAVLLLGAVVLLALNGRLAWIGAHAGWIASGLSLGVGLAAIGVLIAWMERMGAWVFPLGLFCGGLAPMVAVGLVLASAWRDGTAMQAAAWTRPAAGVLLVATLCAVVLGSWATVWRQRQGAEIVERARVEQIARNAEAARREALSPIELLREDYAEFSPDTPLWVFIAGLPDPTEADVRDFIIARALQVPNLDDQLVRTITDAHPRYRHAASEFARHAPAAAWKPAWADAIAASMRVTAAQIAVNPDWLVPDAFSNPDPVAHIASLIAAAARLPASTEAQQARAELHAAIAAVPAGTQRDRALAAFAAP